MVLSEILLMELPLDIQIQRQKTISYKEWLRILKIEKCRPEIPEQIPEILRNIIIMSWDVDPFMRPSAAFILETLERCIFSTARNV